jgi:AraC-like DNA-binding protein
MKNRAKYPPIEGGLIQSVVLVDRLVRPDLRTICAPSLPGHLLHYVVEGEVEQHVSGQTQRLVPGTAVWYYENEAVEGRILKAPWIYYTVNFYASRLPPPPFERRVWPASEAVETRFQTLLEAWRDVRVAPAVRHMLVHARLLELLLEAAPAFGPVRCVDAGTHLWWDIEAKVREDLSRPIDLQFLQSVTGRSRHSIIRACHLAVGMSPMKRVKEIRLSYARGLVLYSRLPMTEIAFRVGYGRTQELSRDYRVKYGITPTDDRQAGPDYRTQRVPGV